MGKHEHSYSTITITVKGPQGEFHQQIGVRDDLLPTPDTPRAVAGRESCANRVVTSFAALYKMAHEAPPAPPSPVDISGQ